MSESHKIGDSGKGRPEGATGAAPRGGAAGNLKRRKAQAKGRAVAPTAMQATAERSAEPHDSAGIADDKSNR